MGTEEIFNLFVTSPSALKYGKTVVSVFLRARARAGVDPADVSCVMLHEFSNSRPVKCVGARNA